MTVVDTALPAVNGNGTAPDEELHLPVDSFKDAAPFLRRPFTARAVKFKVQSVRKNGDKALCVAYIDARLVIERLNLVCPHLWSDDEYEVVGKGLRCHLTVDGITRRDVGETAKSSGGLKDAHSDAFKRAAVKFGIGVSLYATPQMWLRVDGHLIKKVGDKTYMQTDGEKECRRMYSEWLDREGVSKFGRPLDHGDADDAIGDADVQAQGDPEQDAPTAAAAEIDAGIADQPITTKRAKELADAAFTVGVQQKLQLAATHVHGDDVGDCSTKTKAAAALSKLTVEQADKVATWVNRKADEAAASEEPSDA